MSLRSLAMKSNYKQLGNYIQPVNQLNEDGHVKELLGISNNKYFQKSHTNTIGIDLRTYRITRTGQFAYNRATTRNGDKISIALRQGNDCIVSPSYRIFKVKDENVLLSEYLLMWFKRQEFDRYVRFKSHGSAHEFFELDQMSEVQLPVPHIDKQREIVKEYNVLVDRINLNNQLIQKLEETAQAIYKQWFVDFEFPDEKGRPYKSSGGKMEFNEELEKDIPKGWGVVEFGKISNPKKGRNITREQVVEGKVPVVAGGVEPSCFHNKSNTGSPVVTISASGANAGYVRLYHEKIWASDSSFIDKSITQYVLFSYIFLKIHQGELTHMQTGTGQPHIYPEHIKSLKMLSIPENLLSGYENLVEVFFAKLGILEKENGIFMNMKDLLLSKMATINN